MRFIEKIEHFLRMKVATPKPLVRRLDHVVIETSEPKALFDWFTEKLGFPVMWPFENYGRYECGGVYVGNTTLEILKWNSSNRLGATPPGTAAHPQGLAIEPSDLDYALPECMVRGVPHEAPYRHIERNAEGVDELIYTNVLLPRLFEQSEIAFFCNYSDAIKERKRKKVVAFGPIEDRALGVIGLVEVVFPQKVPSVITPYWRRFMLPDHGTEEGYCFEHVQVRIVPESEGPGYLRFLVKSISEAKPRLEKLGLQYTESGDRIWIEPASMLGLRVCLSAN